MTNEQAWGYAASWGSYMRSGDPGACMYGFNERFFVQSEEHRQTCLNYIETSCRPLVVQNPEHYEENELEMMDQFVAKLKEAPVA